MAEQRVKVRDLVVDTGAFLRNAPLQKMAENIFTTPEVIGEVKSKWALEQLQVLPYQIQVREPEEEDLKFAISFAKKTGDYFNLSATDLNVIALSVAMERRANGGSIAHLNTAPKRIFIVSNVPAKSNTKKGDKFGFNFKNRGLNYNRQSNSKFGKDETTKSSENVTEEDEEWQSIKPHSTKNKISNETEINEKDNQDTTLEKDSKDTTLENESNTQESDQKEETKETSDHSESEEEDIEEYDEDDIRTFAEQQANGEGFEHVYEEEEEDDFDEEYEKTPEEEKDQEEEEEDDDDGDWIRPDNISFVKKQFQSLQIQEKNSEEQVSVACITGDFSIQNVLMQMGIKLLSIEKGLIITRTRQFVLRCIACYKITNNTTKMFCPSCGNLKTLKKVSVSVDENGQKRIHLNPKRPVTTRDVKMAIPRPRKGRHALNPILAPDQHVPKFKASKFAVQEKKTIAQGILSDVDYLVRDNPFSVNDIYSKASKYKTGSRAAAINKSIFNEGRKHANKRKDKRRN